MNARVAPELTIHYPIQFYINTFHATMRHTDCVEIGKTLKNMYLCIAKVFEYV